GTVQVWDSASGQPQGHRPQHGTGAQEVVFHPNQPRLFTVGYDPGIWEWDTTTGRVIGARRGDADRVRAVGVSSNGRALVVENFDHSVRVWDAGYHYPRTPPLFHAADARGHFAADGVRLVTAGEDGGVRV